MKPLYHRGDIPVKGFALPFIEDFPVFSPQDLFILRFGYSFRQPRRNAAGSRKTIFVVCTIKTYRATNECWKTGLPRPVSCVWNVPLTPRRTAGPGPARVLVHPSETWSHPRGTLGRCLKGSEINIQDYKNRNCSLCPFRPESRIKPVFPGSAHKIQPAGKAIFSVRGGLHFCPKCGIIFCCKNIRMSVLLKEV